MERILRNELFYPDILPFEEQTVEIYLSRLQQSQSSIAQLEETANESTRLLLSIHRTDCERLNYTLTSYMKIRLEKIQALSLHIAQSMSKYRELLSPAELDFHTQYYALSTNFVVEVGELQDFIAKRMKIFDTPPQPFESGAFFVQQQEVKCALHKETSPMLFSELVNQQSILI